MRDLKNIMDEIEHRLSICKVCEDMRTVGCSDCVNNKGFRSALDEYRRFKDDCG